MDEIGHYTFKLYAYGTLKRGCINHEAYCQGAVSIHVASVRGRLYELPEGFPILEVPDEDIFATGTNDPVSDIALSSSLAAPTNHSFEPAFIKSSVGRRWHIIHGEVITFTDPFDRLPALDELEGFQPGDPGLYRRVLLPVHVDGLPVVLAWAYVLGTAQTPLWLIEQGSWPR